MESNIGIIIQARTGSTRLPNKMVIPFYNGISVLELLISRILESDISVPLIVATTINESDDSIVEIAKKWEVDVFRGSEQNVLNRFIDAANQFKFDKVIRICADNPFLDIKALKYQIKSFSENLCDYWSYKVNDVPTILSHYGFWTEGVTVEALKRVSNLADENKLYLEHVTNYIYTNPNLFKIEYKEVDNEIGVKNDVRLTIDTEEDFKLAKIIYSELVESNISITPHNIIEHVYGNQSWVDRMRIEILKNKK